MIEQNALVLEQLDLDGVRALVDWATAEGWNPGPNDAEVFYNTDPQGFWGYCHQGKLIAGGSIVAYGEDYGFMGFFIVKPEYRAAGIGRRLWHQRRDKLVARLRAHAPVGMDGVVAMQAFYHQGGFEVAYRDERHECRGAVFAIDPCVTAIRAADVATVLTYDALCFGYARPQFLLPWLSLADAHTFKYMNNDGLQGYAVLRKCGVGYKAAPLFANNAIVAEELYKACLNAVPGEPVFLDIPTHNTDAVGLVRKYNTTFIFECARMYLYGMPPAGDMGKVFGITSFELG